MLEDQSKNINKFAQFPWQIRRVNPTTYVLVIQNASAQEQGLYSVEATNLAGTSSTSAFVHVEKYNSIYKPIRTSALDRLRHRDAKAYE